MEDFEILQPPATDAAITSCDLQPISWEYAPNRASPALDELNIVDRPKPNVAGEVAFDERAKLVERPINSHMCG